jgi:hypothetical protein
VIRLGNEMTDRFISVPVAFDLVAVLVQTAAAIAVGKLVGIVVLERFLRHG